MTNFTQLEMATIGFAKNLYDDARTCKNPDTARSLNHIAHAHLDRVHESSGAELWEMVEAFKLID